MLKSEHHLDLPRRMQIEFSGVVQQVADGEGGEISAARIWSLFQQTYLERNEPLQVLSFTTASGDDDRIEAVVRYRGEKHTLTGSGNGPIAAFVHALSSLQLDVRVLDYVEHATGAGEEAQAASYLEVAVDGRVLWGCGVHPSIVTSSLRGIVSAVNRVRGPPQPPTFPALHPPPATGRPAPRFPLLSWGPPAQCSHGRGATARGSAPPGTTPGTERLSWGLPRPAFRAGAGGGGSGVLGTHRRHRSW